LGQWNQPHRNSWVNQLGLAIRQARGISGAHSNQPVLLAAHSLGCHAVAWWAQLEPEAADLVQGALLVAPAEVDFFPLDERLASFAPTPSRALPFPSLLVASQNDPYMGIHTARQLARRWGAGFVDSGALGHINADSGLGDWPQGQALLGELLAAAGHSESPAASRGMAAPDESEAHHSPWGGLPPD
jgi:predicted alpha/beta hydrolase family esterase